MRLMLFFLLFSFSQDLSASEITDAAFRQLLKESKETLVYTVSSAMPLSSEGLSAVMQIAKDEKIKLVILNDPSAPVLNLITQKPTYPVFKASPYFLGLGLMHHYPALGYFQRKDQCGVFVPGYKDLENFRATIKTLRGECRNEIPQPSLIRPIKRAQTELVSENVLPRQIGYYTRPLDLEWITYHSGSKTYLYNRNENIEVPFQGNIDLIASPDAKVFSLPVKLRFFSISKIMGDLSSASSQKPFYIDSEMNDQYQSIGVLRDLSYRVLTAWNLSAVIKDYSFEEIEGDFRLKNSSIKTPICVESKISTPILSKNGAYLGAFMFGETQTKTTHVLEIDELTHTCRSVVDLGQRTGKLDFSYDHKYVTYIATNENKNNLGAYVTRLEDKKTWEFATLEEDDAISFPSFLPNGNVLLLKVKNKVYTIQEYKVTYE